MASVFKVDRKWRAQVRMKKAGEVLTASGNFKSKTDALVWARNTEVKFSKELRAFRETGVPLAVSRVTVGDLIDAYKNNSRKKLGRTRTSQMAVLKAELGDKAVTALTRQVILNYVEGREKAGAGPATVGQYLNVLSTTLRYGGAFASADTVTAVPMAIISSILAVLVHTKRIYQGRMRDRRPTVKELERIKAECHARLGRGAVIPWWDIILFATASSMRLGEITSLRIEDFDPAKRTVIIRDRKDPMHKEGNHQPVPLLAGPFVWEKCVVNPIEIMERHIGDRTSGRVFPYNANSISCMFNRMVDKLKIEDLNFHDFRHEGISRLFEAGYSIEQVALVSGHKNWKNLKRYTNLRPEALHRD